MHVGRAGIYLYVRLIDAQKKEVCPLIPSISWGNIRILVSGCACSHARLTTFPSCWVAWCLTQATDLPVWDTGRRKKLAQTLHLMQHFSLVLAWTSQTLQWELDNRPREPPSSATLMWPGPGARPSALKSFFNSLVFGTARRPRNEPLRFLYRQSNLCPASCGGVSRDLCPSQSLERCFVSYWLRSNRWCKNSGLRS